MGEFGSTEGHEDLNDSVGGLMTMITNSRLPAGYEPGRFHLLLMGCYFKLSQFTVVAFSGLNRHGATPPTAPQAILPAEHAYRATVVCYPLQSALSQAGSHIDPFASLPNNKLLHLGPEITTHR